MRVAPIFKPGSHVSETLVHTAERTYRGGLGTDKSYESLIGATITAFMKLLSAHPRQPSLTLSKPPPGSDRALFWLITSGL